MSRPRMANGMTGKPCMKIWRWRREEGGEGEEERRRGGEGAHTTNNLSRSLATTPTSRLNQYPPWPRELVVVVLSKPKLEKLSKNKHPTGKALHIAMWSKQGRNTPAEVDEDHKFQCILRFRTAIPPAYTDILGNDTAQVDLNVDPAAAAATTLDTPPDEHQVASPDLDLVQLMDDDLQDASQAVVEVIGDQHNAAIRRLYPCGEHSYNAYYYTILESLPRLMANMLSPYIVFREEGQTVAVFGMNTSYLIVSPKLPTCDHVTLVGEPSQKCLTVGGLL